MTYGDWRAVHDCKVKGTWNLHHALDGVALDFFVLMSSISGCVGHPGQANYTSANSFLDSFAQYRQGRGEVCSVINLGGMADSGFLSERPEKMKQYRTFGLFMLFEQHLLGAVQLAVQSTATQPEDTLQESGTVTRSEAEDMDTIAKQRLVALSPANQFIVGLNTSKPLSDPTNRALFRGDIRVSLYDNIALVPSSATNTNDDSIRDFLLQVETDPTMLDDPETQVIMSVQIGLALFGFLLLPKEDMKVTMTLASIGVDSLAAIEIRNWWRRMLGVDVTVLEIMKAASIEGLGKMATESLRKKYGRAGGDDCDESSEVEASEGAT